MFYTLFVCGHYFFNTGLYKSTFFYLLFWETTKIVWKGWPNKTKTLQKMFEIHQEKYT